ncbi:CHAT domain-containing protein [Pseudonocardiaceae bacterium YIM PH 21723]|nr:CHAT domain-containing protein [Pseudonocardiaceae bacterium YIM PH 21723]
MASGVLMVLLVVFRDRDTKPANWIGPVHGLGVFIVCWSVFGGDVPALPWLSSAVLGLLTVGATLSLARIWADERRPNLDLAFDAHDAGRTLLQTFDATGDIAALESGIDQLRTAVRSSEAGTPTYPFPADIPHARYTANLLLALRGRYQRLGDPGDLDEAIDAGHRGIEASGRDPRRGALLAQLSAALRLRHEHFGDADDLQDAVDIARQGMDVSQVRDRADRLMCTGELSAALRGRYEQHRDPADLDAAIEHLEAVLTAGRERLVPTIRVADLTALSGLLVQRYLSTAVVSDVDRAVLLGDQAVANAPAGFRQYESARSALAHALTVRFAGVGERADLDRAIDLTQQALAATPPDDPSRARLLLTEATGVFTRYRSTGEPIDRDVALAAARKAAADSSTDTVTRLRAGMLWTEIAISADRYADAVTGFEGVIELLPRIAARELHRGDQEHRLAQWTGIASAAAACAIESGDLEKAVQLLEQGRGVLLARELDVTAGLPRLHATHPELARRLEGLRLSLAVVYEASDEGPGREAERRARLDRLAAWDRLLTEIRGQDGFADFGRPPRIEEFLRAADHGPVIILNVSGHRSDAIILAQGGIRSIPLPGVTPDTVDAQLGTVTAAVGPRELLDLAAQRRLDSVLRGLWADLVSPVLRELGIHAPGPGEDLPRLWWVPTGPLALLPIHAAGLHDTRASADPQTLVDRTVSSYAPTVRSLSRTSAAPAPGMRAAEPLVVAMSATPDHAELPGAPAETDIVRRFAPAARILADEQATRQSVLDALPGRSLVHFVCHAVTDPRSPSRARLLLHDHRNAGLTVLDISRLLLSDGELAYLSACETAMPGTRIADEAIHLSSAFQLAGFRQVIAGLWQLHDKVAVRFAEEVYRRFEEMEPARAVREATLSARELMPNLPGLWAGHVHIGR